MHESICTFIKGGIRKLKASEKITRVRYFYNFSTLLVHRYVVDLTAALSGESRPRRYTQNKDEEQNKRACIYQAVLMSRDFIFIRQGSGYLRLFGSLTKYAGHSAIAHFFYRQNTPLPLFLSSLLACVHVESALLFKNDFLSTSPPISLGLPGSIRNLLLSVTTAWKRISIDGERN